MLESLAAWVLNTYIGEYLENLNTDQLSVALLQGQVELENVPLKRTALRKFDIPLTVKAGVLGKLTLSVPLTHMRSAPWVVKISDLHVLLEPSENKYDVEFDERYEQGKKQQQLEALEAFHKKQLLETAGLPTTGELSATGDGHGGGWLTYGASLVSTIVENIQLILTNVHIRYEDPHTLGGERSFTSGARIKRVTVQTTNAFWKPGFVQPSYSANLYKVLELSGLSVYWNSGQQCSGDIATYRELMSLLVPDTAKDNCYILEPVSAQVRMEKNTSKFPLKSKPAIPRFRFDLEPDKVAIEMTKQQLAELRLLTREWGRYDRARRHRKWRPKEGVHGHARAWWNFAYERLLDETRRAREKRTIHYKTTRAKHLNAYCRAYRRRLEQFLDQAERRQKVPADSSDMRASSSTHSHKGDELDAVLMKQIENDAQYTYEELHLFRDTVFRRVLDERAARRKSSSQSAPSDDMFVSIGDDLETPRSSRSEHDFRQVQPERPPQSAGLYGWISSWFSGSTDAQAMSSSMDLDAEKFVSTSDLSSWSAFSDQPRPELPPYLRRLEKQLEEEIMDVLNESWDDSTMLRRDALLAQIRIRMKTFTIRFVDEEVTGGLHTQASLTKILALELSDAYAQFRLSPRHHSTAISLTVGDLSVQRLQVHKSQWSGSTDQEDSLMYGFNEGDMNTTVLFALGKSPSVKRNHAGPIGVHGREPPLLRMVYERRAPRLVARHTLDAEFSPITIMYHEDAPVGLSNLFETDIQLLEEFVSSATNKPIVSDLSTHVFATIRVPEVTVELRSKQLTFGGDQLPGALSSHGAAGKPFACAHFHKVALGVANTDDWITEIKIGVAGVELEDLLETTEAMLSARYLLKAGCFELPVAQLVQSQYLSSSCPDLSSAGDDVAPHSSSLPPRMRGTRESREEPISVHTPTFTPERTPKISRKTSLTTMDGFGEANQSQCFVTVSLIDSRHPQFDSRYSKVGCCIRAKLADLDIGMNRQTWTVMLDFLGVIAPAPAPVGQESDLPAVKRRTSSTSTKDSGHTELQLAVQAFRVHMNQPNDGVQLGTITLSEVSASVLADDANQLTIVGSAVSFAVDDKTPHYSKLYSERIIAAPGMDNAKLEIVKFGRPDPNLMRECDMTVSVKVNAPGAAYVHTHRYFCALLDYWMYFFQLQDVMTQQKSAIAGQKIRDQPSHGTRVLLNVDVEGPLSLVLPLNQLSTQAIVAETSAIHISNRFVFASQASKDSDVLSTADCPAEEHDCLLDEMSIVCSDLSLHDAVYMSGSLSGRPQPVGRRKTADFGTFFLSRSEHNALDKPYQLVVQVFRNLDGAFAHNVPDLAVAVSLSDVRCRLTLDFYKLIRGFLERNLGDELPAAMVAPVECRPTGGYTLAHGTLTYATFSYRMHLTNVKLDCLLLDTTTAAWSPFARVDLDQSRMSFDVYTDGTAELDLICQETALVDSRFEEVAANNRPNAFPKILCANPQRLSEKSESRLMSEAHIMLTPNEPPKVTLLLADARVLLLLDWLNTAKDFVLSSTDFIPPEPPHKRALIGPGRAPGVVTRRVSVEPADPNIELKINLRESDLVLLEEPSSRNSLALIAQTTAVLTLKDMGGVLKCFLEIQSVRLSSCVMAAFLESQCQLTNSFAATFDLSVDELMPLSRQARSLAPGLPGLYEARHKFSIEISELIARLSYRDYLVVHSVLTSSIDRLKQSVTESAIPATKPKASGATGGLLIDKVSFKTDQLSLWLLDDFQDTGFPLVRATFSDVVLDHALQSCPMTGMASLKLACDYFNQRVFGWEPLIEPWNLQWLSWQWHASKSKLGIDIRSDNTSTLDLNLTQAFLQQAIQFSGRWTAIKEALDKDFRSACSRARSDHLPYMLKNDTGSDLLFTTAVADVESARVENRKPTVRWSKVAAGEQCSFAFPTRRLTFARDDSESRQMIVQVDGWDEISPVNVDSVGTYFRVARFASSTKQSSLSRVSNARLVVAVSMDQDGRKVVTVRSALTLVNGLPDPIEIHLDNHSNTFFGDGCTLIIPPREARPAPLKYAIAKMGVRPKGRWAVERHETVDWQSNKDVGVTTNRTITCIDANNMCYRMCVSVKREHYPQQQAGHEMLPGHTITFMPPLTVVNLLPTDVEFSLPAYRRFDCIPAGQELLLTAVDMSTSVEFSVSTDLFRTLRSNDGNDRRYDSPEVTKAAAVEGRQLRIRLHDGHQRPLDLFVSISLGKAGAVRMALWVPYWIVNKSGIPLIVKQDASGADDAAGQFDEHESAKDKSSLMFSFANDNCPYQCVVRIGKKYIDSLSPKYSRKFHLTPGVQEIKLALESGNSRNAEVYSIGVEVRQGQGRYKATQVVLFTPRYILANRTAHKLIVAQKGFTDKPDKNIAIAPNCHFVWHWASESISIGPDARMLCLKREDVKHWSCPFQIDSLRSFHVNIRDAHDTPRFLRVEIGLSSAVFTVTVTDAEFFPPPIRIENRTDVPIIYQQQSTSNDSQFHLRTICKAQCSVDYAWDDLYAPERLTLQVFENKSQTYDLKVLGQGTPLVYENDMYLRLTTSFKQADSDRVGRGEERELVLEALAQGKVVLNKYNPVDSSRSQLWRLTREGSLENVGLNQRSPRATPMVLDVLDSLAERSNYPLMMKARNPARDHYQLWTFTEDGRLCCRLPDLYVQATAQFDVVLGPSSQASKVASGVPREQHWTKQKQRPGSGRLNVECMHEGPTQVLRITDWADDRRGLARRSTSVSSDSPTPTVEVNVFMDKGVGLSLVNGLFEELVYCRLEGLLIFGKIENGTYSLTGQVMQIQADNQLLTAEQWPVLYCRAKQSDEPNKYEVIPALRLEMRWSPMHNYDAFDCFRAKLRKISVKLDENLLWKLVQFMQMSGAESVQPALLLQPPNTELSRPDTLKARRCYFGTLELGCDMVYLSVLAVAASSLSPELRRLKQQFNVKLVSFENASIPLPPFRQSHYFETFPFLVEAIQKHFAGELQGHALRILGTVDFLGNPMGLAVDVADGLQDLMMEGTVGTLVSNVGYGLSNSISKISSSMADGVGMMTFDEQHETARRKALRYQPTIGSSAALGHLYTGVKGLGVGVIGGLTSIVRNTYDGSRREGVPGAIVGLGTGAIATVTKPMQGIFDLVGGTASAVKEMVGGPSRKARFAESRIRLPRVTRNLQGLLPCYSENLADAQQQLLRINGYNTNETCLSIEPCSVSVLLKSQMYALICSEQCYIIRQTDDEPNVVTMRISYKNLKEVRAVDDASGRGYLDVIVERRPGHPERLPKIWCSKIDYAKQLCEKILRAKQLHDHSKRTLVVAEDFSLDLI